MKHLCVTVEGRTFDYPGFSLRMLKDWCLWPKQPLTRSHRQSRAILGFLLLLSDVSFCTTGAKYEFPEFVLINILSHMVGEVVLLYLYVFIRRVPDILGFWFTDMIVCVCSPLCTVMLCVWFLCVCDSVAPGRFPIGEAVAGLSKTLRADNS